MRIETYGSGWPGGARALLYINDALEATHTTNLPADDEMVLFAGFANDEVLVADVDVYVSPMTFLMRRLFLDAVISRPGAALQPLRACWKLSRRSCAARSS